MNFTTPAANDFRGALEAEAPTYRVTLTAEAVEGLLKYYELLNAWNSRLHLVAPTSAREFATRHVLESLLLLEYLPRGARLADIGPGAGLPSIPCLIVRPDIAAILIEASKKKAVFLREALKQTASSERAQVIAERFQNMATPEVGFVTCRALERFKETLPDLLQWAPFASMLLLFGGEALGKWLEKLDLRTTAVPIPSSKQRFLFVVTKG